MSTTTHQIYVEPSAIVVGLPDEHLALCHEVIGQAGIRVHRALAVDTACERIPRLMPQLVVADAELDEPARSAIEDRAIAVGAVLVMLSQRGTLRPPPLAGPAQTTAQTPDWVAIERQLEGAVAVARARFGRS